MVLNLSPGDAEKAESGSAILTPHAGGHGLALGEACLSASSCKDVTSSFPNLKMLLVCPKSDRVHCLPRARQANRSPIHVIRTY